MFWIKRCQRGTTEQPPFIWMFGLWGTAVCYWTTPGRWIPTLAGPLGFRVKGWTPTGPSESK
jgi:hypothetical protein